jgi:hypothetical protein
LVAVCGLAAWRGRTTERLAAGAYAIDWLLSVAVSTATTGTTQWRILAIDSGLLIFLLWLAMRSGRFWPLFAAGFHLLAVVTHLARAADPRVGGWAYQTAELLWSYMVIFTIGYGAWTTPRVASAPATDPGPTLR